MLSSLNLFRSEPCPLFEAGLCDRPHCPFVHCSNSTESDSEIDINVLDVCENLPNIPPQPSSSSVKNISKSKRKIEATVSSVSSSSFSETTVSEESEDTSTKDVKKSTENKKVEDEDSTSTNSSAVEPEEDKEFKLLEEEYEKMLLGTESDWTDGCIDIDSDIAEQFLMPEDTDSEDPHELVGACYKEWLKSKLTKDEKPLEKTGTKLAVISEEPSSTASPKKRLARPNAITDSSFLRQRNVPPQPRRPTPAEVLQNRYDQLRKRVNEDNLSKESKASSSSKDGKRVAHVPQSVSKSSGSKTDLSANRYSNRDSKTVPQSIEKGSLRKAHAPAHIIQQKAPPVVPRETLNSSKIPLNCRQQTLNQLFKACEKIYPSHDDACKRALAEETALALKHKQRPVYVGAAANCLKRLRDEVNVVDGNSSTADKKAGESRGNSLTASTPRAAIVYSHEQILAGKTKHSWSIESKTSLEPIHKNKLYRALKKYLLSSQILADNGYPRKHPSGDCGRVTTKNKFNKQSFNGDPTNRVCDRCSKKYRVGIDGNPVSKEICVYHYGRNFKRRGPGGVYEARFTCCDGDSGSGCSVANIHVSSHTSDEIYGFVSAIKEVGSDDTMGNDPWDIVAIDCEMVYTTYGNELARVTVISAEKKVLYDELVKPIHPIIDYNTRYSGITEEMMDGITTKLTDVQAVMLSHLRPNSILVGHSLESDLIALKIEHSYIIDTSILLPHRLGPPYKRALRNLASECLGKIIQTGEGGHDSAEDALSALEIVLWKLQGDRALEQSYHVKRPRY